MICGNFHQNVIKEKMRICESSSAELFREAASLFLDDVYARISDLESNAQTFVADLIYNHACLSAYIQKYKRAISVKEMVQLELQRKKHLNATSIS